MNNEIIEARIALINRIISILQEELLPVISYEEQVKVYELIDSLNTLIEPECNCSTSDSYDPFDMSRGMYANINYC